MRASRGTKNPPTRARGIEGVCLTPVGRVLARRGQKVGRNLRQTITIGPPVALVRDKGPCASPSLELALQLQQPAFEVSLLCGGLMSAPPSRPSNDEGWLNAPLRQSDRYAPDFLHRPGNRQAWR